jgi:ribosome-associated protein
MPGRAAYCNRKNKKWRTTMGKFSLEEVKEMARLAINAMEDKKAEDIRVIDISQVSVLADYFIIASGSNRSQIQTLSDAVEEKLGKAGYPVKQIEGYQNANWVLLDFGDIIVHIFDQENRLFYDLERIWRDGRSMDIDGLK